MMKKEITKDYEELEKIACPFCGKSQGISYETGGFITFWGEESVDFKCEDCGKDFFIQERVIRYWEVAQDWNNF